MNWLYILVMGYIILSALRGFHKGFLRVIYGAAAWIIAVLFIAVTAPMVRNVVIEKTPLEAQIETGCEKMVRKQVNQKLEDGSWMELAELPWVTMPKTLKKELNQAAKDAIPGILESQGIYQKMARAAAEFCIGAIAFLVSFFVIAVILFLVGRKLDLFSKKPGIHLVNMIFGFLAGAAKAFLVIWVIFLLIDATKILPSSASLLQLIEENAVLRGLHEKNQVLILLKSLKLVQI